jgi:predicted RNA-binding Zn-ribbon protein involved in translation (DUF1610 family)
MDFLLVFTPLLTNLGYLIPIAVLVVILKTPTVKGKIGEFTVNVAAKLMLDKNEYHLIKDAMLPTKSGTTQIDHIIVSKYGVFVVETKNLHGWIFGSLEQKMWTQKIFKHTNKFQNPIHQNFKHVKTLQELLNLPEDKIYSLVVFVGDSAFKTEMPSNVTHGSGYIRFIKSKSDVIFSDKEVKNIISRIENEKLKRSFSTNRNHLKHVQNIISQKRNDNSCPKCGGEMILRTVTKEKNQGNQFLGCKKYPKCNGSRKV